MPEPWNTIIALVVGLPLCFIVLGAAAFVFFAGMFNWSIPDLDDDL